MEVAFVVDTKSSGIAVKIWGLGWFRGWTWFGVQ